MRGNSRAGQTIVKNLPEAYSWNIEFREYDYQSKKLEDIEHELIKRLRPLLNDTYGVSLTKEEIALKHKLTHYQERIENPPEDLITY
jgi:hypothetical protein